uniref:Uncharacterized protein n=1 Tax=Arundo donax TaxID=35708 RepID=A0A0A9DF76_ARUDO
MAGLRLRSGHGRGPSLAGARDLGSGCSSVRRGGSPCRRRSRSTSSSCARSSPARAPRFFHQRQIFLV